IATAIVSAQKRGVRVRVVADGKANGDRYSAVTYLANNHVPVRLNSRYVIMHNKVMIADGSTVQTGSFNYTASADTRNAENNIVLRGVPQIAAQYEKEFNRLWAESEVLAPAY
ncbi:phospholipase D-like domain-containing protein, partial [Yersinia enterocolitica]